MIDIPEPKGWYQRFIDKVNDMESCPLPKGCTEKRLFVDDDGEIINSNRDTPGSRECPLWTWHCPHGQRMMHTRIDNFLREIDQPRLASIMKDSKYKDTKAVAFCKEIVLNGTVYGLHGDPGTGKTAGVAIGLFRMYLRRKFPFLWLHARDIFVKAQDREWLDTLKIKVLVIDDLGTEQDKAEYNRETNSAVFDDIVDVCYRRMITLIYTTNLKDLSDRYNERALSRIEENRKMVYLSGEPNYRKKGG